MGQVGEVARRAHNSDGLDAAVRVGLVAYGLVHLLVGWLALQIAFGEQRSNASSTGAMHTLATQPLGGVLLWVAALGLLALVVWRGLEARRSWITEDGWRRVRSIGADVGRAAVYVVLAGTAIKTAAGSSGGGAETDDITAQVLRMPGGTLLVGAVGLGVVGYAGWYVWQGLSGRFLRQVEGQPQRSQASPAYRALGTAGYVAKGVAIGVIGGLLVYAAATHEPKKSGGLDQALQEIAQQPFGQVLLVAVAAGIACYGLFCFAQARHLQS